MACTLLTSSAGAPHYPCPSFMFQPSFHEDGMHFRSRVCQSSFLPMFIIHVPIGPAGSASRCPSVRRVVLTSSVAAVYGDGGDRGPGHVYTDQVVVMCKIQVWIKSEPDTGSRVQKCLQGCQEFCRQGRGSSRMRLLGCAVLFASAGALLRTSASMWT
jgi:hypothetical protein